jgi:hypothetical protein
MNVEHSVKWELAGETEFNAIPLNIVGHEQADEHTGDDQQTVWRDHLLSGCYAEQTPK